MELSIHNSNTAVIAQPNESLNKQWQDAAAARALREHTRAHDTSNNPRVAEAFKVERLNHKSEARELRPITIDDTRLNKVRAFLTVAQNGMRPSHIDLYV